MNTLDHQADSLSLSQLCDMIQMSLSRALPATYWVRAEIAELRINRHAYFELVEKADNGTLAAKIRATCWAQVYDLLSEYFLSETSRRLSVGMQVLLEVEVAYHSVYGMSLNIVGIDPQYTLGGIARAREQAIEQLHKDGTFDMQRMLALPLLVRRVAVVSSAQAAGYQDFCHQLSANSRGISISATLFQATMQGDSAAESIIEALQRIFERQAEFDAIVIIRGGGATTDMGCFDSYPLASVCSQMPLPIITGIGHTRDVSVVDMVAFASVKTPTAAAEYLLSHNALQQQRLQQLIERLARRLSNYTLLRRQALNREKMRLRMTAEAYMSRQRNRLLLAEKTIMLQSPEAIFRKGYSVILRNDGTIVRRAGDLQIGEAITIEFFDGSRKAVISE